MMWPIIIGVLFCVSVAAGVVRAKRNQPQLPDPIPGDLKALPAPESDDHPEGEEAYAAFEELDTTEPELAFKNPAPPPRPAESVELSEAPPDPQGNTEAASKTPLEALKPPEDSPQEPIQLADEPEVTPEESIQLANLPEEIQEEPSQAVTQSETIPEEPVELTTELDDISEELLESLTAPEPPAEEVHHQSIEPKLHPEPQEEAPFAAEMDAERQILAALQSQNAPDEYDETTLEKLHVSQKVGRTLEDEAQDPDEAVSLLAGAMEQALQQLDPLPELPDDGWLQEVTELARTSPINQLADPSANQADHQIRQIHHHPAPEAAGGTGTNTAS